MLTEQKALEYLRKRIPESIFLAFSKDFYIDILNEESLVTFSTYYPFVVRGICITAKDLIHSKNPTIAAEGFSRYHIPLTEKDHEYIDISTFYINGQGHGPSDFGYMQSFSSAMKNKVASGFTNTTDRNTVYFEPPNIARVEPAFNNHIDFTVNMKRVCKIYEVPVSMRLRFFKLLLGDVKIALYNDLREIEDGGIYNGIEIKGSAISSLENGEELHDEVVEFFEKDYYKNPERFEEILGYNDGY